MAQRRHWSASPTRPTCLLRAVRSLRRPPPAAAWPTTLHTLAPTSTRSHRYEAAATHTSIGCGAAAAERGSVQTAQSRWPSACARARKRAGAAPSLSSVWAVRSSPTALATRTLGSTTFAACSTAAARPRLSRARATPRLVTGAPLHSCPAGTARRRSSCGRRAFRPPHRTLPSPPSWRRSPSQPPRRDLASTSAHRSCWAAGSTTC